MKGAIQAGCQEICALHLIPGAALIKQAYFTDARSSHEKEKIPNPGFQEEQLRYKHISSSQSTPLSCYGFYLHSVLKQTCEM